MDHERYDAIVLGAGISGLVTTALLLDRGCSSVLVVDEFPAVGGNHIDVAIGPYTFDIGSFLFDRGSPFLHHFPEALPLYAPAESVFGRLNPQGRVTYYPFSARDDLLNAGPLEWAWIAATLGWGRAMIDPDDNALAFAQHYLGSRLVKRAGLAHYMKRFYGVAPELIEGEFARKRMGWIPANANLRHVIPKRRPKGVKETYTHLVRPREGFHALYGPCQANLERRGAVFRLGEKLEAIVKSPAGAFLVMGPSVAAQSPTIVSTIPIEIAMGLCGLPQAALSTVELQSLFYSFKGARGFRFPVLYNFDTAGAWKRLTMHSDFYGLAEDREFFSVEVNAAHVLRDTKTGDHDFASHVRSRGLFDGDLRLEGARLSPHAYPVYVSGATATAARAQQQLREFGILSYGRQGGFDYQPTAIVSTKVAEAAIAQEFAGGFAINTLNQAKKA